MSKSETQTLPDHRTIEELKKDIRRLKDNIEGKEKQADNDWRLYKQTKQRKSSVKNYHFANRFEKGEIVSNITKKDWKLERIWRNRMKKYEY